MTGPPAPRCWGVCDYDADGLSAAALARLAGLAGVAVSRDRQCFPAVPEHAEAVWLLDLSPGDEPLPWTCPTLAIDHHPPVPERAGLTQHNGHGRTPPTCTSLLVHELLHPADSPHAWLAALGALSDLGDHVQQPLLQGQLTLQGRTVMRDLTSLINAPHRGGGEPEAALEALLQHGSPAELVRSSRPEVKHLRACQKKVRRQVQAARQIRPLLRGRWVLVPFRSDGAIQGLVAQVWRSRFPRALILAANHRLDAPERVSLSARGPAGEDVIGAAAGLGVLLRGHRSSAGAQLSWSDWERFLERYTACEPS